MKKNYFLLTLLVLLFHQVSLAQSINNWQLKGSSDNSRAINKPERKNIPLKYKVFSLDFKTLKSNFKSAAKRDNNNRLASAVILDFPLANGKVESFLIEKTSVLHPDLEAKFPEIQSFYGVSQKNPLNQIYISISPEGFTGLITGERTIYIDPFSKNNVTDYIVYDRADFERSSTDSFVCNTEMDAPESVKTNENNQKTTNLKDSKMRTYRIAIACTSEYTEYYGNTVAGALAGINATMVRVNSVYRRDLAVQFQIVPSNNRLIYRNGVNSDATPAADPYDNYDGSQMLSVNTNNISTLIGAANYDIGHVFSTGGGGIAGFGPCVTASKGRGVTGIVTPQFDPFDIDYVCHEIGHQFGAGHTQNNACQFASASGLEPGSGSTIMGYAGICPPNIQNNSDAYFHAISIQQMTETINGNMCEVETTIANAAPTVTTAASYTIPSSTPFTLTAVGADSNGDALTYTWEQMDKTDAGVTGTPQANRTTGPNFRSFMPTSSPSRTFPNMQSLIDNVAPTWEVLPSVARTINFRVTVRDNNAAGGQTNQANTVITIGNVGPFAVTAPNTAQTWYVGESKTVTWRMTNMNNTTYATNVNIKMSTDGGLTYPILLAGNTPNDGSQAITVPSNIGTTNRILIEAVGNIFFDISNVNFEIKSNKFDLTTANATASVCRPNNATYTATFTPAPGFSETVTFSAVGLPAGASATFSPTTRTTAGNLGITITGITNLAIGTYNFTVRGTSATAAIDLPLTLRVFDATISNVTLNSPSNGAQNQATSVLLQWSNLANASSYLVQISDSPTFASIRETATVTTNTYQTTNLISGTINYWRVQPINACNPGNFSDSFVFQIASDFCNTYSNVIFSPNANWEIGPTNAVSATINIPDNINITKTSFYMKASHTQINNIKMQFSGPTGVFVEVFNRDCSGANFDVTFDDNGLPLTCGETNPATSAALEGIQQASQPLAKFNGTSSLGKWTLLATDRVGASNGGNFSNFSITICGKLQVVNNITIAYTTPNVLTGTNITIGQSTLLASQPAATPTQLIYNVTKLPTNGILRLNGNALAVGSTFTQLDINNNLLTYTHNGANLAPDNFTYTITGINNAYSGGNTATLNICSPVTPTFSAVGPVCSGSTIPALPTTSLNGITGTWSPALNNTATTTYTFTPNAGQCGTTTTLAITVDPVSVGGTVAGGTTICSNSNSGLLTLTGFTGNIINWESAVSPFSTWTTIPNTTNSYTSGPLTATTRFRAVVKNGSCNPTPSAATTVTIESTTWNGSAWSNGLPAATKGVIITGNFTANANLSACSLTVNNNAVVTVPSGFNFTIANDITVAAGSSLTFENNTNLLQTKTTNGNSGSIVVKRRTSALRLLDYVLWSSPVAGQQLQAFSPATLSNRFYSYNSATDLYSAVSATSNFTLAKGFLIRLPNNHPTTPTVWEGRFQGVPNNGTYNIATTANKFNGVGNPYPSTISANTFISTNNITEPLYFWRKTNNTTSTSYATYTTAGGTANAGGGSSIVPNGFIQVGQGFLVKPTTASVTFNNTMRVANNDNQFLKIGESDMHRIWLNLSKDSEPANQMMIAYMPKATAGIDATIDGRYINDNAIALNSLIDNEEFVIQGRSLPFENTDSVPLTFKTNSSGSFTIGIDHVDGLFSGQQDIFIKDKQTSIEHDLKKSDYTFTSTSGTFNDRFVIVYKTDATLGLPTNFDENTVIVYNQNGVIHVNSGKTTMKMVRIYDIRGRLLFEKNNINGNLASLTSFTAANQTLIIKIISDNNETVNKKIIY